MSTTRHPSSMAVTSLVSNVIKSIWVEKRAGTLYFSKGVLSAVTEKTVTLSVLDGPTMDFSPKTVLMKERNSSEFLDWAFIDLF